jgi:type IV secretory pathway VirD2 relaxase
MKPATRHTRRVVIKTRLVVRQRASPATTAIHLRYIQRGGVSRDGHKGQLYSRDSDQVDTEAFERRLAKDRHQFRFIVSPEDAAELRDLKDYTRSLMRQMEEDLGTKLDWVAADHWDTDNPHTHILLRGRLKDRKDLIISGDYIARGMRGRAQQIMTDWLGLRTEREIQASQNREVRREDWTRLDRVIQQRLDQGTIDLRGEVLDSEAQRERSLLKARLDTLSELGLAEPVARGVWNVSPQAEQTLRQLRKRADIARAVRRAFPDPARAFTVYDRSAERGHITGRLAARGLSDEINDRGYLIIDGLDGRAHYLEVASTPDMAELSTGAVITVRQRPPGRAADRAIAALAPGGVYSPHDHLDRVRASGETRHDPDEYVQAHVRRLEALRRAGLVERLADGDWRVPADLVERAVAYDRERGRNTLLEVQSTLPVDRQVRLVGATWLDGQFGSREGGRATGFGAEVSVALAERKRFLIEQGFVDSESGRIIGSRAMQIYLRTQEVETAGAALAKETGLTYQATRDGERVTGVYRRNVTLASGRFAMLEDGLGFSLVPWRPVIEARREQTLTACIQGDHISWDFRRQRELSR